MNSTRVFFAAELDIKVKNLLSQVITLLKNKPSGQKIHWSETENLHLTFRFLGNIQKSQILALAPRINNVLRKIPPFRIELATISLFPTQYNPRVIVADLIYSEALQNLFAQIEQAVVHAGFAPETRPARPHITLGRINEKAYPQFNLDLSSTQTGFLLKEIVLYQSVHELNRIKYQPLERYKLG